MSIHPTAIVSSKSTIGKNVSVGAFSIIHDDVILDDDTVIESHCELGISNSLCSGKPLVIGRSSLIRSHSVLYADSVFGDEFITGHRVTVREKVNAGKGFQIGTLGDIQGHCVIGDYVKCHSNVHIGQKSKIGSYVWIFPYVVLTNDPHPPSDVLLGCEIQDYAVIATMSVILPGVTVASDTLVAAGSILGKDFSSGNVIGGNPAQVICSIDKIRLKDGSKRRAYPWRKHFHRGYPSSAINTWVKEFEDAAK